MRFVFGVVIGFGIGLGAAILFAPAKNKKQPEWPPAVAKEEPSLNGESGVRGILKSVKGRVKEAMSEAREAQKRAEKEMIDRYERSVGRKASE